MHPLMWLPPVKMHQKLPPEYLESRPTKPLSNAVKLLKELTDVAMLDGIAQQLAGGLVATVAQG